MHAIACPFCDTVNRKEFLRPHATLTCRNCQKTIMAPTVLENSPKRVQRGLKPGGVETHAKPGPPAVNCPVCDDTIKVKLEHLGKKVPCPSCGAHVPVPKPKAPKAKTVKRVKAMPCDACGAQVALKANAIPGSRISCKACGTRLTVPGRKSSIKRIGKPENKPEESGIGFDSGLEEAVRSEISSGRPRRKHARKSDNSRSLAIGGIVFALGAILIIGLFSNRAANDAAVRDRILNEREQKKIEAREKQRRALEAEWNAKGLDANGQPLQPKTSETAPTETQPSAK